MTSTGSRFEYFTTLHHDFSQLYPAVNQHVLNLYSQPRKFILETSPVINGFLQTLSVPGQPGDLDMQKRGMLDFVKQVDEFTGATITLFEVHKLHVDRCSYYMQTIADLDKRSIARVEDSHVNDYINLTPQLIDLHNGLRELANNADSMAEKLKALEQRWAELRDKFG